MQQHQHGGEFHWGVLEFVPFPHGKPVLGCWVCWTCTRSVACAWGIKAGKRVRISVCAAAMTLPLLGLAALSPHLLLLHLPPPHLPPTMCIALAVFSGLLACGPGCLWYRTGVSTVVDDLMLSEHSFQQHKVLIGLGCTWIKVIIPRNALYFAFY